MNQHCSIAIDVSQFLFTIHDLLTGFSGMSRPASANSYLTPCPIPSRRPEAEPLTGVLLPSRFIDLTLPRAQRNRKCIFRGLISGGVCTNSNLPISGSRLDILSIPSTSFLSKDDTEALSRMVEDPGVASEEFMAWWPLCRGCNHRVWRSQMGGHVCDLREL